jgi:hypothetical protein
MKTYVINQAKDLPFEFERFKNTIIIRQIEIEKILIKLILNKDRKTGVYEFRKYPLTAPLQLHKIQLVLIV